MRVALVLCLSIATALAADEGLAARFPSGATAYLELNGLAGTLEAAFASPLGQSIRDQPALRMFLESPQGRELRKNLGQVEQATGLDGLGLLRALAGKQLGFAVYGDKNRTLLVSRTSADDFEKIVAGVEQMFGVQRTQVLAKEAAAPALWSLLTVHFFYDGTYLVLSPDRFLATAVRSRVAKGLGADARLMRAKRATRGESTLFGFVDLNALGQKLRNYDKPKELGEAMILGAFAHYVPHAPWAAFTVDLRQQGEDWTLSAEGFVPVPAPQQEGEGEEGAVAASYRGTLKELPFALPEQTVGIVRMHRSLASIWSNRDDLIAAKGIPGLIAFETNFGNLAGGLNWVEEVLPNIGDELILLGTRRIFDETKPAPAVRFPQGALLIPLKSTEKLGDRLQVAFNNTIAIININQGKMGYNLMTMASDYKGTRILQASYMSANKGEMSGKKALPTRFNFAPACATLGDYFVLASHGDIIKELIDNYGRRSPVPEGINAGIWLRPRQVRTLLAENREPLIAHAMVQDGISRAEAEGRIQMLLDLSRSIRSFSLTSRDARASVGLRLEVGLGG